MALDHAIRDRIGTDSDPELQTPQDLVDVEDDYLVYKPQEPEATQQEADEVAPEVFDYLISAKVLLPKGDVLLPACIISRKRDGEGNLIGTHHSNPIMDTRIYDVQFPDGHVESYAANVIAENIYAQVDDEGRRFLLLAEVMDH
jgi:hypothetical protein